MSDKATIKQTYTVQLYYYASSVNNGSVELKARSPKEAWQKALAMAERDEVEFTEEGLGGDGEFYLDAIVDAAGADVTDEVDADEESEEDDEDADE